MPQHAHGDVPDAAPFGALKPWPGTGAAGAIAVLAEGSAVEFGPSPPADSYGEPPMDWHLRFYA